MWILALVLLSGDANGGNDSVKNEKHTVALQMVVSLFVYGQEYLYSHRDKHQRELMYV